MAPPAPAPLPHNATSVLRPAHGWRRQSMEERVSVLETHWEDTTPNLATVADIGAVRSEVREVRSDLKSTRTELKAEIQEVRTELKATRIELKAEIQEVRTELKAEIQEVNSRVDQVRTELKATRTELGAAIGSLEGRVSQSIAKMETHITRWFLATTLAMIATAVALILGLRG